MVEMHLLSVNASFAYDPIYALGVVTTYDRFMDGYRPEGDKASIFSALCKALNSDPQAYRRDAEALVQGLSSLTVEGVLTVLSGDAAGVADPLRSTIAGISARPAFKYSRLFGVGIFTLLEAVSPDLVQKEELRSDALKRASQGLKLPLDKLQKDLESYRDNLEKMAQARIVMEEAVQAERKKREQREQERLAKGLESGESKVEATRVSSL